VLRDSSGSSSSDSSATAALVTPAELEQLAAAEGHPVYWLGPRPGHTYELTRASNGSIFVRYLPQGVEVGSPDPYLTVVTYPFAGALAALQEVAKESGSTELDVADGGLGVVSSTYPQSVHVAYPDLDYQIEVYDPTAGLATAAVAGGELQAAGSRQPVKTEEPTALTLAGLNAFAKAAGQPVYWAGPRVGRTYEVTRNADGQIFIRYLSSGAPTGTEDPHLTVGTYPFENALSAVQALGQEPGAETIELAGGGLAVVDSANPNSIYLAFPDSNYQVEVFDPSAARARQLVSSSQIVPIG
jgi:hypothetical protein